MPERVLLLENLVHHTPADLREETDLAAMMAFLKAGGHCFSRTHLPGHFTGSALLLNRDGDRVLLNHHKALDLWVQFGGHADGNADLFQVAKREVQEESGLLAIEPVQRAILDIDIHPIPYNARKAEPAHLHYDVRYIFRLQDEDDRFVVSDESTSMRWCTYGEAVNLVAPGSTARLLSKWRSLFQ